MQDNCLSGKPRNVREFYICQVNSRKWWDFSGKNLVVRKLLIDNFASGAMPFFSSIMCTVYVVIIQSDVTWASTSWVGVP